MNLLLLALGKPLLVLGGLAAGVFAYRDFPPQPADNPPIGIEEIVPIPKAAAELELEVIPAVEEVEPDEPRPRPEPAPEPER